MIMPMGGVALLPAPSTLKGLRQAEVLTGSRRQLSLTGQMAVAFNQTTNGTAKLTSAADRFTICWPDGTVVRKRVHQDDESLTITTGCQDDREGTLVDRLGLLNGNLLRTGSLDAKHRESPPPS